MKIKRSDDISQKIDTDNDFISSKTHDYSIRKCMNENPEGVSDFHICRYLKLSEQELSYIYQQALDKLHKLIISSN